VHQDPRKKPSEPPPGWGDPDPWEAAETSSLADLEAEGLKGEKPPAPGGDPDEW
jgi:hypothetical protein